MLRGGAEHRELKFSQLTRDFTSDGLLRFTYTENRSKNRCGGFNQLDIENKVVEQFQDLRAGDRCHTYLLHLYFSKVPDKAFEQDIFYVRPLPKIPAGPSAPWFTSVLVGRNTLGKMLQNMCDEGGVQGKKTNHSLRTYAATELFQAGVSEKVIQNHSGHHSLEGLRKYERISEEQKQNAYRVLAPYAEKEQTSMQDSTPSTSQLSPMQQNVMLMNSQQKQQQPTCSFSGTSLSGCTINVYQGATVVQHPNIADDKIDLKEHFSDS